MSLQDIINNAQDDIISQTTANSIKKEAVGKGIQDLAAAVLDLTGSGVYIKNDVLNIGLDASSLPSLKGNLTQDTALILGDIAASNFTNMQVIGANCGFQARNGTADTNPTGISTDFNIGKSTGVSADIRTNNTSDRTAASILPGNLEFNFTKDSTKTASFYVDTGGAVYSNSENNPIRYGNAVNLTDDLHVPNKKYVDDIVTTTTNNVTQATSLALDVSICYTYDGTGDAVFTLPAVIGTEGKRIAIICDSASTITVNSNAGANDIFDTGVKTNTSTINAGTARVLLNNTKNWVYLT